MVATVSAVKKRKWLLSQPSKRLHSGTDGAPVHRLAELAFLQQVLAAFVVRMLVEDPPASQDPAGVNLPPVELLQHRGTVLSCFKHLTGKVPFAIDLDLVRIAACLSGGDRDEAGGKDKRANKEEWLVWRFDDYLEQQRCGANVAEEKKLDAAFGGRLQRYCLWEVQGGWYNWQCAASKEGF